VDDEQAPLDAASAKATIPMDDRQDEVLMEFPWLIVRSLA